jgi:uncharacterized protein (DUF2235 family)
MIVKTCHVLSWLIEKPAWSGLEQILIKAYAFICYNFAEPDDEIILIGFSQGAFAIRCLADLILDMGLLDKKKFSFLHEIYDRRYPEKRDPPTQSPHLGLIRKTVRIKACAVWDTVT